MTLGVVNSIQPIKDYEYETISSSDPTNNFATKYTLPVGNSEIKNQGVIGACVACAMATILESHYKEPFSEGWNYGALRDDWENFKGMIHGNAIEHLKDKGGLPKSFFDILKEMPKMKEITNKYPELVEESKKYSISGYVAIHNGDTSTGCKKDLQIKDALIKYKTPLFAISPHYFGESHAICIIGWDDEKDRYIFQNSWGEAYGDKGYGIIPKDKITNVYLFLFEPIKLPFHDVNESDWFYPYVKKCYLSGIINGKTETEFEPNGLMTRAEAATMMSKLLDKIDERFKTLNKIINTKIEENL